MREAEGWAGGCGVFEVAAGGGVDEDGVAGGGEGGVWGGEGAADGGFEVEEAGDVDGFSFGEEVGGGVGELADDELDGGGGEGAAFFGHACGDGFEAADFFGEDAGGVGGGAGFLGGDGVLVEEVGDAVVGEGEAVGVGAGEFGFHGGSL